MQCCAGGLRPQCCSVCCRGPGSQNAKDSKHAPMHSHFQLTPCLPASLWSPFVPPHFLLPCLPLIPLCTSRLLLPCLPLTPLPHVPPSLPPTVSYEYVACQRDNAGVLILSEFAGAAQSLGGWQRRHQNLNLACRRCVRDLRACCALAPCGVLLWCVCGALHLTRATMASHVSSSASIAETAWVNENMPLVCADLYTVACTAVGTAGAGAILVNPWNINDLSQAIEYALMMSDHGGWVGGWVGLSGPTTVWLVLQLCV